MRAALRVHINSAGSQCNTVALGMIQRRAPFMCILRGHCDRMLGEICVCLFSHLSPYCPKSLAVPAMFTGITDL